MGFIFTLRIAAALGAEGRLLEYCITYGRIFFCSTPAYILQYMFQSLFSTAEKPRGIVGRCLYGNISSAQKKEIPLFSICRPVFWGKNPRSCQVSTRQKLFENVPLVTENHIMVERWNRPLDRRLRMHPAFPKTDYMCSRRWSANRPENKFMPHAYTLI